MKKQMPMKVLCWFSIITSLLIFVGCNETRNDPVTPSTDIDSTSVISDQPAVNAKTIYTGSRISRYDNADPERSGCAKGAYRVGKPKDFGAGVVELWWSPTCKTNWARVKRNDKMKQATYAGVYRSGKSPAFTDEKLKGYNYIWTNMVYASGIKASAYGCVAVNGEWFCDCVSQFPDGLCKAEPTDNNAEILGVDDECVFE